MKAITVSVNYGDYLNITAKYNHRKFDEVIVVTTKSDDETINVCRRYKNYTPIILPDNAPKFHPHGEPATFNKGYLLNKAFDYLESNNYKGYICSTDSDTIFSPKFNNTFKKQTQKLSKLIPNCNINNMLFGLPRYFIGSDTQVIEQFMRSPNVECARNKNGQWIGKHYDIKRTDNEAHERLLLGYCQMYYIDTEIKETPNPNSDTAFYRQSEQFKYTMGLDTKLIGKFMAGTNRLNLVKRNHVEKAGLIFNKSGKGTCSPGYNFEVRDRNNGDEVNLWGCHIEDPSIYCVHIGRPKINMKGRVSKKIT